MWDSGQLLGKERHLILNGRLEGCGGNGLRHMRVRMGCIGTRYVCGDGGSVSRSLWTRGDGQDLGDSEGQGRYFVEAWARHGDIHDLQRT